MRYYCAVETECCCLVTCGHSHASVREAVACLGNAGSYVVAVDDGTIRSLSRSEEAEFQKGIHSCCVAKPAKEAVSVADCTAIDSRYAVMSQIRVGDHWAWNTWMCFASQKEASAHARAGDKVVRFRSAEWRDLRRDAVSTPNHVCADSDLSPTDQDEMLVETVLRLLSAVESDLGFGSAAEQETINSEGNQQHGIHYRKRA